MSRLGTSCVCLMEIYCGTITSINSFLSSFNSTLTYQGVMGQTRLGLHTFIGTIVTVWSDSEFIGLFMLRPTLLYHCILPLNLCSRIISITILNYLWYITPCYFRSIDIQRWLKLSVERHHPS